MSDDTATTETKSNKRSGSDRRRVPRSAADRRRIRNRIGGALLAIILGGVTTVYACSSERIAGPGAPPTSSVPGKPNAVTTDLPEQQESIPDVFSDPCTGELVEGTRTTRTSVAIDENLHITIHTKFSYDGFGYTEATDPITGMTSRKHTGTSYRGSGEDMVEYNDNVGADKFETTNTHNMRVFATNSASEAADDFLFHYNTHVTVFYLPPRFTATVDHVPDFTCK